MMSSACPSVTWSFGGKPKTGSRPHVRTSRFSLSSLPTGACGSGIDGSRSCIASHWRSTATSSSSRCFSSEASSLISAIARCFSSPAIDGTALLTAFRRARMDSTRGRSSRRFASMPRNAPTSTVIRFFRAASWYASGRARRSLRSIMSYGSTKLATPWSRVWWFALTSSIRTLCGPAGRPLMMSGLAPGRTMLRKWPKIGW